MTTNAGLPDIATAYPEWAPWLDVLGAVRESVRDAAWEVAVPDGPAGPTGDAPLLAGAKLDPGIRMARWIEILRQRAARSDVPEMEEMGRASLTAADALAVFRAAVNGDDYTLTQLAAQIGSEPAAFRAFAALVPVPYLHACRRRWANALPLAWPAGYCPCCGAWPAFAEIRGIERTRYLRCGRCGSGWPSAWLSCPYCANTDHHTLGSLVPGDDASQPVVEVCKQCRGYLKAFTRLGPTPPESIMPDDLDSVALDLAAAQHGYGRPAGLGHALDIVVENGSSTRDGT